MAGTTNPLYNTALYNSFLFGGPGKTAGLQPRQVGQGILYPALRKAGVTLGPGRTPSSAQFQDAIDELNRLTASLNCDRLFIYSIAQAQYPLLPPKPVYTIGLSDDPFAEIDFPTERPQLIERANIIQDQIKYPLILIDADQWSLIGEQILENTIPQFLYNDRAYPVSSLYFWGFPMGGQILELFAWTRVPAFQTVTDVVLLPPQYEDAMVLNLAVRLAPQFQKVLDQNVREDARLSLMRLLSINAPKPVAAVGFGCSEYDIYSDTWR